MSAEQQNNVKTGLSLRKVVIFIFIAAAIIVFGYTYNPYAAQHDIELFLIFILPFVFGVLLIVIYDGASRLIHGLPLISLLAILMWLFCLYQYQVVANSDGDISQYDYLTPLVMILIIIMLLLEYTNYLLNRTNQGTKKTVRKFLDNLIFGSSRTKSNCSFDAPNVILFSSFSLFISITILFGFALAFDDLHLRGENSTEIGLYIDPKSTINIQRSKVYSQVERRQALYGDIKNYVFAMYESAEAKNDLKAKSYDLDKAREKLVKSITYQSFPRSVLRDVSKISDDSIYSNLQDLIEMVDKTFLAFYKADAKLLNQNSEAVSQALFLATNYEGYPRDELLGFVANQFVLNTRRGLSDKKTGFLVLILDLHQHMFPFARAQYFFTLEHAERIKDSNRFEEIKQSVGKFVQNIHIHLSDKRPAAQGREKIVVQVLTSATDYTKKGGSGNIEANKIFATERLEKTKQLVKKSLENHNLESVVEIGNGAAFVVQKGNSQAPETTRQVIVA